MTPTFSSLPLLCGSGFAEGKVGQVLVGGIPIAKPFSSTLVIARGANRPLHRTLPNFQMVIDYMRVTSIRTLRIDSACKFRHKHRVPISQRCSLVAPCANSLICTCRCFSSFARYFTGPIRICTLNEMRYHSHLTSKSTSLSLLCCWGKDLLGLVRFLSRSPAILPVH